MRSLILVLFAAGTACAQPAGELELTTLDGDVLRLGAIARGGPTLVTFWALWCSPCKQELRALQDLHERYADKGFTVVAVNQDTPRSLAKVRSYVASQRFTFPVVLDPNGQMLQRFSGQAIPFSVMLDTTATVVHTSVGYLPGDERKLEDRLQSLLASP